MPTRRELPPDFAAALDRVPEARDRFSAMRPTARLNGSTGSNPAAPATVPSVVGQDQAAAATALRQAGFKVVVLFRKTADQTKDGIVLEEQPPAGSSIPSGSYVAIFVGRLSS
ncbi:MAG: PASTA domain-containing protein [Gaiellaceae bacterium]